MVNVLRHKIVVAMLASSVLCLAIHDAAEAVPPVAEHVDQLGRWASCESEAATERLIDCLSDDREIDGDSLEGASKETWSLLRSTTNVEITVSDMALHYLCDSPSDSKLLLAERIRAADRKLAADRTTDWSREDGYPMFRLLHALAEVHFRQMQRSGIIPRTQIVIEIKCEKKAGPLVLRTLETIVVGYVDHRDQRFKEFASGTTREGNDRINTTRLNIVPLADAIRDLQVTDSR